MLHINKLDRLSNTEIFVGIDIAKYKHCASIIDKQGKNVEKPFFIENSKKGLSELEEHLEGWDKSRIMVGV